MVVHSDSLTHAVADAGSSKRPAVWIEIQKESNKEGSRQRCCRTQYRKSGVMCLQDAHEALHDLRGVGTEALCGIDLPHGEPSQGRACTLQDLCVFLLNTL